MAELDSFATPAELSAYTKGLIPADDPRSQVILDGASAAIRNYCGWNISPPADLQIVLDGGTEVLYLPSLKVNAIAGIVSASVGAYASGDYEWSRLTGNVRLKSGCTWPDEWGGLTVDFNSGYSEVPADLKQVVLQVAAQALSSPTGATREQAGQVSMQWATTAPGVSGGLSLLDRDLATVDQYRIAKEV